MGTPISQITFRMSNGQSTSLGAFEGKVVLLVNVASECGLTPQYDGLEKMYEKYKDQGLMVLGFPANEFGEQEPGSNEEIQSFCKTKFGVQFPVVEKIVVKGEGQHPLYKELTSQFPVPVKNEGSKLEADLLKYGFPAAKPGEIIWNFEKFLVNRRGEVVGRYAPDMKPEDAILVQAIEAQLAK